MKTLKIGIATYDQFKARTIAIAKGQYKPQPDEPKIWFHSLESFAKLLSAKNRTLLALIAHTQPGSLQELAEKTSFHEPQTVIREGEPVRVATAPTGCAT